MIIGCLLCFAFLFPLSMVDDLLVVDQEYLLCSLTCHVLCVPPPLDAVSGSKPSPYDIAELLDPVENKVAPLTDLPDFVTVPSEAMNVS